MVLIIIIYSTDPSEKGEKDESLGPFQRRSLGYISRNDDLYEGHQKGQPALIELTGESG